MKITSGMFVRIADCETALDIPVAIVRAPARFSRYEYTDGSSNKFWEIRREGSRHEVRYGRIGTSGQQHQKEHNSISSAMYAVDALVREKLNKGYVAHGYVDGVIVEPEPPAKDDAIDSHWRVVRTIGSVRQRPIIIFTCKVISSSRPNEIGHTSQMEIPDSANIHILRKCNGCNELFNIEDGRCINCIEGLPDYIRQLTRDELIERLASRTLEVEYRDMSMALLDCNDLSQSNWNGLSYIEDGPEDDAITPVQEEKGTIEKVDSLTEEPKEVKDNVAAYKKNMVARKPRKKKGEDMNYKLISTLCKGDKLCKLYLCEKQYKIVINNDKTFTRSFSKESVALGAINMLIASRKAMGYVEQTNTES